MRMAILLGLLPGLLLQAKGLPSEADLDKALATLEKEPDDPDANLVAGKYKAFVLADFDGAMPYLRKSKDATLKKLAEHEVDPANSTLPEQKMKLGDEWLSAGSKAGPLRRGYLDRASHWYALGWRDLEGPAKLRARAQALKLAAARPQGAPRKGLPTGWEEDRGLAGLIPTIDHTVARTGSYSIRVAAPTDKGAGAYSALKSAMVPITGKSVEVTAYALSGETENPQDKIALWFFNTDGAFMVFDVKGSPVSCDTPYWLRYSIKTQAPANAVSAKVVVPVYSKSGAVWVDDVSMKVDGREVITNGSFEK